MKFIEQILSSRSDASPVRECPEGDRNIATFRPPVSSGKGAQSVFEASPFGKGWTKVRRLRWTEARRLSADGHPIGCLLPFRGKPSASRTPSEVVRPSADLVIGRGALWASSMKEAADRSAETENLDIIIRNDGADGWRLPVRWADLDELLSFFYLSLSSIINNMRIFIGFFKTSYL